MMENLTLITEKLKKIHFLDMTDNDIRDGILYVFKDTFGEKFNCKQDGSINDKLITGLTEMLIDIRNDLKPNYTGLNFIPGKLTISNGGI